MIDNILSFIRIAEPFLEVALLIYLIIILLDIKKLVSEDDWEDDKDYKDS